MNLNDYKVHRNKYFSHRGEARKRGIPWHFSFIMWWKKWCESGKWSERGNQKGQYQMARYGDIGPYAPWNVRIITIEENTREAHLGCKRSKETRDNIARSKTGIPMDDKTKSKISKTLKGRRLPPNHKAKIAQALRGVKHTPERKANISAALTGKKQSMERRHKQSEAMKKYWQRQKEVQIPN